jgi:hypothetical protein
MRHKTSIRSLRRLGLLFVALVFLAFGSMLPVGVAQATNLNFVVWSYGIETIKFDAGDIGFQSDVPCAPSPFLTLAGRTSG